MNPLFSLAAKLLKRAALAFAALVPNAGWAAPAAPAANSAHPQPPHIAAPRDARPALWRLRDADTTIYLFGTVHALPEGMHWQTPAIRQALDESQELVMEIVQPTAAQMLAVLQRIGIAHGLPPILQRVPPARRAALRRAIADTHLPVQAFDTMKTWYAAVLLEAVAFGQMGLTHEQGVEPALTALFEQRHRTISGLETAEQQLGFLDQLSPTAQRAFLLSAVSDAHSAGGELRGMIGAWARGDVGAVGRLFESDADMSPELRAVLIRQRNARWADWLVDRLRRPGTIFVAVGAGHLAGNGSVRALLAARGVHVERVE